MALRTEGGKHRTGIRPTRPKKIKETTPKIVRWETSAEVAATYTLEEVRPLCLLINGETNCLTCLGVPQAAADVLRNYPKGTRLRVAIQVQRAV